MKPSSGLMPFCYASASSKAYPFGVRGCHVWYPLVGSYLLSQEEPCLKGYGAITTWGSILSNPSLKSLTVQCPIPNLPSGVACGVWVANKLGYLPQD